MRSECEKIRAQSEEQDRTRRAFLAALGCEEDKELENLHIRIHWYAPSL